MDGLVSPPPGVNAVPALRIVRLCDCPSVAQVCVGSAAGRLAVRAVHVRGRALTRTRQACVDFATLSHTGGSILGGTVAAGASLPLLLAWAALNRRGSTQAHEFSPRLQRAKGDQRWVKGPGAGSLAQR